MRKFTLEIELGNDAMQTSDDVAKVLEAVADRLVKREYLEDMEVLETVTKGIKDANGNTIGSWRIGEEQ